MRRALDEVKWPLATLAGLLLVPAAAQAHRVSSEAVAPRQELATMLAPPRVRAAPRPDGRLLTLIDAERPITRERTVLPVLARATDNGGLWLRVRLPGRALNHARPPQVGWISAANTLLSSTPWHIVVDVQARRVRVYRDGRQLRSYAAIVGKPSTPTPKGEYFVEENVRLAADLTGAPFALAISARSNVLQEFAGGPGQIALHGLGNIGGRLGSAVSHGCVRLADGDVTWLAARIQPGVPVTIT